jgi:DNA-binding CsgD family transcriptional regulator
MSNNTSSLGSAITGIALFSLIFLLIALDLAGDYREGTGRLHVFLESGVLLLAAAGIGMLLRRVYLARASVRLLQRDLDRVREESERWREDNLAFIEGLGTAIRQQFIHWELTMAESDVALFLLKGLSFKEIAAMRETSERTVREQAGSVYRKAGISSRSALTAFFLEDLLLPTSGKAGSRTKKIVVI